MFPGFRTHSYVTCNIHNTAKLYFKDKVKSKSKMMIDKETLKVLHVVCSLCAVKLIGDKQKTQTHRDMTVTAVVCLSFRCTALSAVGLSVLLSVLLCYCIGKASLSPAFSLSLPHTHCSG